jgi:short-subunit dehydrogenase
MKIGNNTWVITGAGSGMGRELAIQMLAKGATIIAADINMQGLEETRSLAGTHSAKISLHQLNIADKAAVENFAKQVIAIHSSIDGIINNAGIIQPFIKVNELSYEEIERVMQINFYGTLYMIKSFLPHLHTRPESHIVNVTSMAAFIPFPGQSVYSASKAAVRLLTEGLYSEHIGSNVHISVVMPGAVNTNITFNSIGKTPDLDDEAAKMAMPADKAASVIIDGIEQNRTRILVGKDANFLDKFYRLAPTRAIRFITDKMKDMKI